MEELYCKMMFFSIGHFTFVEIYIISGIEMCNMYKEEGRAVKARYEPKIKNEGKFQNVYSFKMNNIILELNAKKCYHNKNVMFAAIMA